jgi:SNF2 family DNA or RNA helicase
MSSSALYQHQKDAVRFATENDGSCALFHDPGLGKTRTCLEIFKHFRSTNPDLRLLVVCPLSLVNSAWGGDIKRFTDFSYSPFKDLGQSVPDIVVVNYEALISKRNFPKIEALTLTHDFMCVLDESSRLKNHKSITTKTLLELRESFEYRIVASGTPMPNSESELWGQINFIKPSVLHKSFYGFRNTYFHLERNGEEMHLRGRFVTRNEMREILSSGWRYAISSEKRYRLMEEIKPFTHWVKKEEALDLPEKIDEIREVTLSPKERDAYDEMEEYLVTEIDGTEIAVQAALAKIMKLRQVTSGFLYSETHEAVEIGRSSKLKELEEILEELGNQPVIIWVQFHHEVRAVQKLIADKYGASKAVTLYSETKDRDDSIRQFQSGQAQYLIAHPKSAGHGLTFVNASVMVFLSLDYSYETHTQARDRIHRIGQNKSCLYIYIVAKNSIDEALLLVLQKKRTLQEAVYAIVRDKSKKKSHRVS